MQSFVRGVVCVSLLLCAVQAADHCLNLYRRDLCQTWSVKQGEPLCNQKGDVPSSSGQGSSGVTISVIDSGDFYISTGYTSNSKLSDNYYSSYGGLGGEFGVALWRDKTSGGIILRMSPSSSGTFYGNSDSNDGLGAYVRYTVYTQLEKTGGSYNPELNLAILILNLIGAVALIYLLRTAVVSVIWLILYPIIVGFLQANIRLDNTGLFLLVCLAANAIAFCSGYFVSKQAKNNQIIVVLATAVVAGLYMIIGNPGGYGLGLFYIFPCFVFLAFGGLGKCCLIRYQDQSVNKVEAVSLLSFSIVFAMNLFYFTFGFPAIHWLTIQEGVHDYVKGSNTDGIVFVLLAIVNTILTISFFAIVSCYYNRRPANFFKTHEADGDFNQPHPAHEEEIPRLV